MLITEFFENQEVFITGGSGFIGKALIEKLLYSCRGITKIYVLIRGKKNKTAKERLLNILQSSLCDRLRRECPEVLDKVVAIEGDCCEIGLGIKPNDLELMKNVNIIYHSAASVRFDDHLRDAILLNTRGTLQMVKLAEKLKKLKAFVHVSTTYCNPHNNEVDEKVYPAFVDWRAAIKLAETYDTHLLNTIFPKYSNDQPNTYTFTKGLSEQIIKEYMDKLPMIIFRPSIVISAIEEPVPGWMDNFNGPNGLLVACGIGLQRTSYGDPNIESDFVPIDFVVRCMIVASYYLAVEKEKQNNNIIEVVNCCSGGICPISLGYVIDLGKRRILENPFENTLWAPGGSMTKCYFWHLIRFIFLHIFVAILIDSVLRLSKMKPFMLRVQRRIFAAMAALHYFTTKTWKFNHENLFLLQNAVPEQELEVFGYLQFSNTDYEKFVDTGIRGAKMFLLNQPPEASEGARKRLKMFRIMNFFVQFILYLIVARYVIRFLYMKFS